MAETKDELLQTLFQNMAMISRLMMARTQQAGAEGIPASQAQILYILQENGPVALKTIADKMQVTPGAVTQLIESLERAKYIERQPSETDRRVVNIVLTGSGVQKILACQKQKHILFKEVFQSLTVEELRTMNTVQQKMIDHLKSVKA